MKEFWNVIQMVFTALGGWIGYFLGGCDGLLYALVLFMVVDYITGLMCGIVDHNLSSEVGLKGIIKKVMILLLVGIGNAMDVYVLNQGAVLRTAVIFLALSNEGLSLLENASYIGVPIPRQLQDVLQQLHDREAKSPSVIAGNTQGVFDGDESTLSGDVGSDGGDDLPLDDIGTDGTGENDSEEWR